MTDRIDDDTPADENAAAASGGKGKGSEPPKDAGQGTDAEILHFNPWRDFNDAAPAGHAVPAGHVAPQVDVFGDEPDAVQIAAFMDVVFGYCEGLIPVRSFIDKGQGIDGRPHNIWLEANEHTSDKMTTCLGARRCCRGHPSAATCGTRRRGRCAGRGRAGLGP